ncbi:MAG: hypothetical protein Ct9H300mP1_06330 [Planctomycetaceae bacterium]|nr:MAG: hypothetical protein Ct9H300mP1_06330 [Planctomycetaceae bacterium]
MTGCPTRTRVPSAPESVACTRDRRRPASITTGSHFRNSSPRASQRARTVDVRRPGWQRPDATRSRRVARQWSPGHDDFPVVPVGPSTPDREWLAANRRAWVFLAAAASADACSDARPPRPRRRRVPGACACDAMSSVVSIRVRAHHSGPEHDPRRPVTLHLPESQQATISQATSTGQPLVGQFQFSGRQGHITVQASRVVPRSPSRYLVRSSRASVTASSAASVSRANVFSWMIPF